MLRVYIKDRNCTTSGLFGNIISTLVNKTSLSWIPLQFPNFIKTYKCRCVESRFAVTYLPILPSLHRSTLMLVTKPFRDTDNRYGIGKQQNAIRSGVFLY